MGPVHPSHLRQNGDVRKDQAKKAFHSAHNDVLPALTLQVSDLIYDSTSSRRRPEIIGRLFKTAGILFQALFCHQHDRAHPDHFSYLEFDTSHKIAKAVDIYSSDLLWDNLRQLFDLLRNKGQVC